MDHDEVCISTCLTYNGIDKCEDTEMFKLCEEVESCALTSTFYDEELYRLCAAAEKQNIEPLLLQVGGGSRKRSESANEIYSVVAKIPKHDAGSSSPATSRLQTDDNDKGNTPSSPSPFPGGECIIRQAFTRQQVPPSAMTLMTAILASLSNNTKSQYTFSFKLWWEYCNIKSIDPFDIRIHNLLDFLADCFRKGSSYGTLNIHRSALSLISRNKVGQDERVKRFLKGIFKIKPAIPRYDTTWDPNVVLNYLANMNPNNSLSLEQLTKKLVVLLVLSTGQTCQTLSLIRIPNIKKTSEGIIITITDIIRTPGIGRSQPKLDLPYFIQRPCVCPANTLTSYIARTSTDRSSHDRLLLTTKRPYHPASSHTIGRWIKQILAASGIDMTAFSAHGTGHATTSAAQRTGVNVIAIRKTAGWSDQSAAFAKFYNRPLLNDDTNFVNALFNDFSN